MTRSKDKVAGDDGPLGRLSRSQLVSTFGVGSIYELRKHGRADGTFVTSVVIGGLDDWPERRGKRILEPVLQQSLNKDYFVSPPVVEDGNKDVGAVPTFQFPRWLVCNGYRCERLGRVGREFRADRGRTRCNAAGCGGRGIPARLVTVCYHDPERDPSNPSEDTQPGHIDDFPWPWWAHRNLGRMCERPQLKLESRSGATGLSGLLVTCHSMECQGRAANSLEGVFGEYALKEFKCTGRRPWLDDVERGCDRPIRALLRGASNVYFAVNASAISIPPFSSSLISTLEEQATLIVASVGKVDMPALIQMVKNGFCDIADRYSDAQIEEALRELSGQTLPPRTEPQQRSLERRALLERRSEAENPGDQFLCSPLSGDQLPERLRAAFATVSRIGRLREVRVLRGFHRVSHLRTHDAFTVPCAPLSRTEKRWLPAIEVRGEGVFFELAHHLVKAWETGPAAARVEPLRRRMVEAAARHGYTITEQHLPTARFVAIHTLSHLIIKQLSLECGYSSASLREKLYLGTDDNAEDDRDELGVLIYTAAPGTDGTLGGLERQGAPERFEQTFLSALEGARWCSSDPLCIQSQGQGSDALNLAACHACCLVSETSCERNNLLLDRALLIGTMDQPDLALFRNVLDGDDQ